MFEELQKEIREAENKGRGPNRATVLWHVGARPENGGSGGPYESSGGAETGRKGGEPYILGNLGA